MRNKLLQKIALLTSILGLQSCQTIDTVIAQNTGELTFERQDNWAYAAKVAPKELIQQVRTENIDEYWIGDPRRFLMIKVNEMGQKYPLYLVIPAVKCESDYCPRELHRPLCGAAGRCSYFVYIEENGKYREVWGKLFQRLGDTPLFKVSKQMKDGVPACLEMGGIDDETEYRRRTERKNGEIFRSRYCYNGSEYVLDKLERVVDSSYIE